MRASTNHMLLLLKANDPKTNLAIGSAFIYLRGGGQMSVKGVAVLQSGIVEHSDGCFDSDELIAVDWCIKEADDER